MAQYNRRGHAQSAPDILGERGFARTFFADLPEAVVFADTERRIVTVNPAAIRMFGYDPSELIGHKTAMLYANQIDYRRTGNQYFRPDAASGSTQYILNYRRRNGEVFPGETTGTLVRRDDGELVGYLGIIREVWSTRDLRQILSGLEDIATDPERSAEDSIPAILELGVHHLQQPLGMLCRAESDTYTVVAAVGSASAVAPGRTYPMSGSFCARTLGADAPVAFHEAPEADEANMHPGFYSLRLESYIGAPVRVDGEAYGIVDYSGPDVRHPFTEMDLAVIRLLAQSIAGELSRERLRQQFDTRADEPPAPAA